ncbi:MAG: glycosyltransferase [Deltaproteobacteria bacterium]|nr:glycosyltransferase [Deltaproteobacteria bacterium]
MNRIIFIQYTNPAAYPPLQHGSRILARAGWHILFLGTRALGADALQFPHHERIEVRQLKFCPAGWRQKLHYLCYCLWVIFWTLRWQPRFIYASDPASCPIALLLSYLPYLKVIYHEHDSPNFRQPAQSQEAGANSHDLALRTDTQPGEISSAGLAVSRFMRFIFWSRRELARCARLCVLPNEKRAARFNDELARSTTKNRGSTLVVWNCPSSEEVSEPRSSRRDADFWILYHGSIVPTRLPLTLLEALATLPGLIKLRIVGYETIGHRGYAEELRMNARRLGINGRVEFLGTVPQRTELLNWCQKSDVGVAFFPKASEDFNQQYMLGASNKPFDYLSRGVALLVSDLPDWRQTYVDLGYGLACDPDKPESIASALRWFVDHPREMRAMGERGRQRIAKDWNYEAQFSPVFQQVTTSLL